MKHYTEAIEADPESETAALCLSNRSAAYQQYVHSQNSLKITQTHTLKHTQTQRVRKGCDGRDEMSLDQT